MMGLGNHDARRYVDDLVSEWEQTDEFGWQRKLSAFEGQMVLAALYNSRRALARIEAERDKVREEAGRLAEALREVAEWNSVKARVHGHVGVREFARQALAAQEEER